jgi:hypothetical protein
VSLVEKAELLPDATTEDLFKLILRMCEALDALCAIANETNGESD